MNRISAFVSVLVVTAALVGCTRFVSAYTFPPPAFGQQTTWKQEYPKDSDTGAVKCLYTNTQTGALIRVVEDPCDKPDAVRSAHAMQRLYRESGYDVSLVMLCETPHGKYASFAYARGNERGRIIAVRRPNVLKTFMLIGAWNAAADASSSVDIEQLAQEFEVEAERVPVE